VATQDDVIPTRYPVHKRDGTSHKDDRGVTIKKGSIVHVSVEAFNLDKAVWGPDAWNFKYVFLQLGKTLYLLLSVSPDRWDNLPEAVSNQPGLFANILTFSAGPRVSSTSLSLPAFDSVTTVLHWNAFFYD
jgi:hypothetical protein